MSLVLNRGELQSLHEKAEEGEIGRISAYGEADADITRRLYESGGRYVLFTNKAELRGHIPVEW